MNKDFKSFALDYKAKKEKKDGINKPSFMKKEDKKNEEKKEAKN